MNRILYFIIVLAICVDLVAQNDSINNPLDSGLICYQPYNGPIFLIIGQDKIELDSFLLTSIKPNWIDRIERVYEPSHKTEIDTSLLVELGTDRSVSITRVFESDRKAINVLNQRISELIIYPKKRFARKIERLL